MPVLMWCRCCQQDVPAVASRANGDVRCPRCLGELSANAEEGRRQSGDTDDASRPRRPKFDHWELDHDLQAADEVVRQIRPKQRQSSGTAGPIHRLDQAHSAPRTAPARGRRETKKLAGFLAWSLLSIGLTATVFGGALLTWSLIGSRPDLWPLGIPFALFGQASLVCGLVFQLDGIVRRQRETSDSLGELDQQLTSVRQATSMLATTHSNPAQSFYVHMAEGASPQMLLADLKGQLDLLATKMADHP